MTGAAFLFPPPRRWGSAGNGYRGVASTRRGLLPPLRTALFWPLLLVAGLLAIAGLVLACLATMCAAGAEFMVRAFERVAARPSIVEES